MKIPKLSRLQQATLDSQIQRVGKHWFYPEPYMTIAKKEYRIQDVIWHVYREGKPHDNPKHSLCGELTCIKPSHLIQ